MGFRGVLFDSGDTLIRPVGGRWNPRFDFEEIVLRHLPWLDLDSLLGHHPGVGGELGGTGPLGAEGCRRLA